MTNKNEKQKEDSHAVTDITEAERLRWKSQEDSHAVTVITEEGRLSIESNADFENLWLPKATVGSRGGMEGIFC